MTSGASRRAGAGYYESVCDRDGSLPRDGEGDDDGGGSGGGMRVAEVSSSSSSSRVRRAVALAFASGCALTASVSSLHARRRPYSSFSSSSAFSETDVPKLGSAAASSAEPPSPPRPPPGVNVGSWLSLEDFFYVGPRGAVEVATPDDVKAAICLPPLYVDPSEGPGPGPDGDGDGGWNSETDLLADLTERFGLGAALRVFHAHRVAFLDFDGELKEMGRLGIKYARVPMSWCLTDHDPTTIDPENREEGYVRELEEKFTCLDPFFEEEGVRWPAIPKSLVASFLRSCSAAGLTATLDIHTYPGGTSIGTFSGVWPRWPRFWTEGDVPALEGQAPDVGRSLLSDLISWVESMAEDDPNAFQGIRAISPMNEPAHLAGLMNILYGPGGILHQDEDAYLPPLSDEMALSYLSELNPPGSARTTMPDGPHLRVLLWLRDAVDAFRTSSLPSLGKELHVNIHESIFAPAVLPPGDGNDPGGRHPGAMRLIASWWAATATDDERSTWAILDVHHYHAWEPNCQGAVDGPPLGNYTCGDLEARDRSLRVCSSWARTYRDAIDAEAGDSVSRLASAEFSASTHHSVRRACSDVTSLRASYDAQMEAAEDADVELFWWSWKMPHGGAFRPAWSLKHFLYLQGVRDRPDESEEVCGGAP